MVALVKTGLGYSRSGAQIVRPAFPNENHQRAGDAMEEGRGPALASWKKVLHALGAEMKGVNFPAATPIGDKSSKRPKRRALSQHDLARMAENGSPLALEGSTGC